MIKKSFIIVCILIRHLLNTSINDLVLPEEQNLEGVPKFLEQPKPFYYIKSGQPVTLTCVADPVSHANIVCGGKQFSYMGRHVSDTGLIVTKFNKNNKIDSNGNKWNISLIIKLKMVSEWFGKYECFCEVWNQIISLGKAKKVLSMSSTILESYFHSNFKKSPVSQQLLLNQTLILDCVPPDAKPAAFVTWMKNEQTINEDNFPHIEIKDESTLIIKGVNKDDQGVYCCKAKSLETIRRSPCADIKIIDSFKWSSWSFCDNRCLSYRTRNCQINQCQLPNIEYRNCSSYSCWSFGSFLDQFENVIYITLSILVVVLFLIFLVAVITFRRNRLHKKPNEQKQVIKATKMVASENEANLYTCHSISSSTDCIVDESRCFSNTNHIVSGNGMKIPNIDNDSLAPYSHIGSGNVDIGTCIDNSFQSTEARSLISKEVVIPIFNSAAPKPIPPPIPALQVIDNSVYNVLASRNNNSFDGMAWGTFSSIGGHLDIPESGVSLFIPRGSITMGISQRIFLTVSRFSNHKPLLKENETQLSPVVICGPEFVDFETHVILTIPHNAFSHNQFQIKLLHSKFVNGGDVTDWQVLSDCRRDESKEDVYIHMVREKSCIMLKSLNMYCLIGETLPSTSIKTSILIKIVAFSSFIKSNNEKLSLRCYVVPSTKEAYETIYVNENKLGGQLLNNSTNLNFLNNGENLVIRLNEIGNGWRIYKTPQTQLIKFSMVWKNHASLGMMNNFLMEKVDTTVNSLSCSLVAYQNGNYSNRVSLDIINGKPHNQTDLIHRHSSDTLLNKDTNTYPFVHPIFENFNLSNQTKHGLMSLLNVFDPSGNDWRLLAREMQIVKTDFFLKQNPTESLLNLWQAQNPQKSYIKDLISVFLKYKRIDCISILETNEGYRL